MGKTAGPRGDSGAPAPRAGSSLSADLWAGGAALRRAILGHPFVRGLGDGSLPPERYQEYMRQDYIFLIDYARVLALAAAAAEAPADMVFLTGLLHATLRDEMALHRRACAAQGIPPEDLDGTPAAPQTHAYTRHLLAVARSEPTGVVTAALLPCQWGYAEIGAALAAGPRPPIAAYAAWIDAYAGPAYQETARAMVRLCDRLGEEMGPAERRRARLAFDVSLRCEFLFWDGCWHGRRWPG